MGLAMTASRPDPFATFAAAADAYVDLVGRIDPTALDRPGLGEWDLRALVGHTSRSLVTILEYTARPADEIVAATAADYYRIIAELLLDSAAVAERGRQAGAALGDDPAATVSDLAERAKAALAGRDPVYVLTTIIGGMPLAEYLRTRIFELVVHCLDIARATGLPYEAPRDALADAVTLAAEAAVALGRGDVLLLALTGRAALPPGFSVV